MLNDILYEMTGSNSSWQLILPQYGTPGSPDQIEFATANTSLQLEHYIPITWVSGSLQRIEPHSNTYTLRIFDENIYIF